MVSIYDNEKVLEDKLKKASGGCCAISATTVTDEEATAAFSVVGGFVPQVHSALASIIKQKSQFDSIPPAAGIYNRAINKLNDDAESLMKCLLDNTPANSLPIANDYVSRVNSAIAEAKNNF